MLKNLFPYISVSLKPSLAKKQITFIHLLLWFRKKKTDFVYITDDIHRELENIHELLAFATLASQSH